MLDLFTFVCILGFTCQFMKKKNKQTNFDRDSFESVY